MNSSAHGMPGGLPGSGPFAAALVAPSTGLAQPRMVARALLATIRAYRRFLSPVLPAVLGPSYGCRFVPTCSDYAAEAITLHGAAGGAWLSVCRLACCQPFHTGGFDPVPPRKGPPKPAARRIAVQPTRTPGVA